MVRRFLVCSFDPAPSTITCPDLHAQYDWIFVTAGDSVREILDGREPDVCFSSTRQAQHEPAHTEMEKMPSYSRTIWYEFDNTYRAPMYARIQQILAKHSLAPKCVVVTTNGCSDWKKLNPDRCEGLIVVSPLCFLNILQKSSISYKFLYSHFFMDPTVLGTPDMQYFLHGILPRMWLMPKFVTHWFHTLTSPYDAAHDSMLLQAVYDDPWQYATPSDKPTLVPFCNDILAKDEQTSDTSNEEPIAKDVTIRSSQGIADLLRLKEPGWNFILKRN